MVDTFNILDTPAAGGTRTLIQGFDIGGTPVASVDFTNLPTTYRALELDIYQLSGDQALTEWQMRWSTDNLSTFETLFQSLHRIDGTGTSARTFKIAPANGILLGDPNTSSSDPVTPLATNFAGLMGRITIFGLGVSTNTTSGLNMVGFYNLQNNGANELKMLTAFYNGTGGFPKTFNSFRLQMTVGNLNRAAGALFGVN